MEILKRFVVVSSVASLMLFYILICGSLAIKYEILTKHQDSLLISGFIMFIPFTLIGILAFGSLFYIVNWLIIAPLNYIITGEYEGL